MSASDAREFAGTPVAVEQVSPVWTDVPAPHVTEQLLREGFEELPASTNQRFFVHSAADLRPCGACDEQEGE